MMETLIVVVLSALVIGCLFWKADRPTAVILSLAYLLRLLVLYADTYQLVEIPFSGTDTEDFHKATQAFISGSGPVKTNYTYVLAALYTIFGDAGRFMSQFLNVLLSFGAVVLLDQALRTADVTRRNRLIAVSLLSFMPATLCLSGVLLREAWVQFFLMLSALCFLLWYKKGGVGYEIGCMIAVLAAMLMHSGCVGALVAYMVGFLICRTWKSVGLRNYAVTAGVAVVMILPLLWVPEYLLAKFVNAASTDKALDIVPVVAGSTYLLWMQKLSVAVRLLLSPVRMFYLLFSPLPFDWRGLTDVAVFCVDSIVYLVLIILMFRPPLLGKDFQLKRFLGYSVLLMTFVFAFGTSNAGTAVRHRAKFAPILILTAACAIPVKQEETNTITIPEQ